MHSEVPLAFKCQNDQLCGILHEPRTPSNIGLLVIVGGPQYRVGSHRQFVYLARFLSDRGITVMRFDYRGMGDSEGEPRTFERIDDDIHCAIDAFQHQTKLKRFVLWGLCDGATAACSYASRDPRVVGLVLVNPWVRSEAILADAYLQHYYFKRMLDRELWSRVFRGRFDWMTAVHELIKNVKRSVRGRFSAKREGPEQLSNTTSRQAGDLSEVMRNSLERFSGKVLILISGEDMTAAEFETALKRSRRWKKLLTQPGFQVVRIAQADHTFSNSRHRIEAEEATLSWLRTQ